MRPSLPANISPAKQLRQMTNLNAAWRQVKANADQSASPDIREKSRQFERDLFTNLNRIQRQLQTKTFTFKPADGVIIRRIGKKGRPIVVAPIESRIVQRALLNVIQSKTSITKELMAGFNYGGVPGPNFGVPAAIAKAVATMQNSRYYIRTDIRSFFVNVPRAKAIEDILLQIRDDDFGDIFRNATKTEIKDIEKYGDDVNLFPLYETGVAQGSALSPLLCNYLLRDFDRLMNDRGITCIRYIDDFIIFANSKSSAFKALEAGINHLKSLGLDAYNPENPDHIEKAEHGSTNTEVHFLGCELLKNRIRPSKEKQEELLSKINEIFNNCLQQIKIDPKQAIKHINSGATFSSAIIAATNVIRGWGNTYSFCSDDRLMKNIDIEIEKLFSKFKNSYRNRSNNLSSDDKRRSIGLFMLDDCNKDDSEESARSLIKTRQ